MSCGCNNSKRQNWQSPTTSSTQPALVRYRYIGLRSLTVHGGVTGKVYYFAKQGDEMLIDQRDVPGMANVPNVTQV
jgi:hypothetical protein